MTVPIIVISSPQASAGKTTLTFNLATALLRDGYNVGVYSKDTASFLQKRVELRKTNPNLKMPQNISRDDLLAENFDDCNAVIADISTEQNADFSAVFAKAHTIITLVQNKNDITWQPSDLYLNLIWNVKKQQAAAGIKCLNWVVLENKADDNNITDLLRQQARRFGFRAADALQNRESYQHVKDGYGAADLICARALNMSMADVYARRELLVLTDFIWQHK